MRSRRRPSDRPNLFKSADKRCIYEEMHGCVCIILNLVVPALVTEEPLLTHIWV
jgi:hypothetical protein